MAERAAAADAEIRERPARRAGSCRGTGGGSGYNSDQRQFLCDDFITVTECLSRSVFTDLEKFSNARGRTLGALIMSGSPAVLGSRGEEKGNTGAPSIAMDVCQV